MKVLSICVLVLALALVIPLAAQAEDAVLAAPVAQPAVAQPAVVDAPLVELLSPSEQPVFSDLQPIDAKNIYCIDSGVSCYRDSDCEGVCAPLTCTCFTHTNYTMTCVVCL